MKNLMFLLTAAVIVASPRSAQCQDKFATTGKIERLDPRFDKLIPKDANTVAVQRTERTLNMMHDLDLMVERIDLDGRDRTRLRAERLEGTEHLAVHIDRDDERPRVLRP